MNAINIAAMPAITNAVQPIFILKAKSCNHLFTPHYANGAAIANEMQTRMIKSFVSKETILDTEAPRTFLTPISFTRCCAANVISPQRPRQEISIVSTENILKRLYNLASSLYKASSR